MSKCPFSNCKFNCKTEYHHRARYAHISKTWRNRVKQFDKNISKKPSDTVKWNDLKKLGIIYEISLYEKEQKQKEYDEENEN